MLAKPRNLTHGRPDASLRWAGRLLLLTAGLVITDLALQPGPAQGPSLIGRDKIEHALAFAALAVFARMGWPSAPRWLVCPLLLAYGAAIEIAQAQGGNGRTASLGDLLADGIGILIGFIAAVLIARLAQALPVRPAR